MYLPLLSLCLVLSATALSPWGAHATDDPWDQVDGLYVGHLMGKAGARVSVELRGPSLVVLDPDGVVVMRIERWEIAGPGGKLGDLQYQAKAAALGTMRRDGRAKVTGKNRAIQVRLRWLPERQVAVLCTTSPGSKAGLERVPPPGIDDAPATGVTCYDLARVFSPTAGDRPNDPGLPAPDFECMRECRQQNMMRAVGPEVIEEDCRKACTQK